MSISKNIPAIACFAIAAFIFVFAEGYRRIYAGIFFVILGVTMLVNARQRGGTRQGENTHTESP